MRINYPDVFGKQKVYTGSSDPHDGYVVCNKPDKERVVFFIPDILRSGEFVFYKDEQMKEGRWELTCFYRGLNVDADSVQFWKNCRGYWDAKGIDVSSSMHRGDGFWEPVP